MSRRIILTNGNIYTLDKRKKADSILIENGKIKKIGKKEKIIIGDKSKIDKIDLKGKTVLPGFIDSHNHMLTYGLTKEQLDFSNIKCSTLEEGFYYLKKYVEDNSSRYWIRCCGFDETKLKDIKSINRYDIDKVISDRPVVITRVCGHLTILNTKALEELNIPDKIIATMKNEFQTIDNELTGIVTENAQQFVLNNIPEYSEKEVLSAIKSGQDDYIKYGICGIHDPGTDQTEMKTYLDGYIKSQNENILKIRTYLMFRTEGYNIEEIVEMRNKLKSIYDIAKSRLYFGGIKLFADGSIGGKTAAIFESYKNDKENYGLLLEEKLKSYIEKSHKEGLQVAIHAIGDRAIQYSLEQINQSIKKYGQKNLRHRIEHCDICNERIIELLQQTSSIPAIQPAFIYYFGVNYINKLGLERARKAKLFKTFLNKNLIVSLGTDCPVIAVDPMFNIHAAVNRYLENGEVLNELERVNVIDAIRGYTVNSAYASFSENYVGTLSEGKFADLIVLNEDIFNVSKGEIKDIKVEKTIINGEIVYSK